MAISRPEVELVPVYLQDLNRILPTGEFLPVPILGSLYFGTPMQVNPGERKAEFLARARAAVEALRNA